MIYFGTDRTGSGSAMASGVLDKLLHHSSAGGHHLLGSSGHVLLRAVRARPRLRTRLVLGLPAAQ